MTSEEELRKTLAEDGMRLTKVGEGWMISPEKNTHDLCSLGEVALFIDAYTAGWLARADLDGD